MEWEAQYGKLAFDQFVLERWDYTLSPPEDPLQWISSAKTWLTLSLAQRKPYHDKSFAVRSLLPGSPGLPNQSQISRVLQPHQTISERNLSIPHFHRHIWLRTCYDPALANKYHDLWNGEDVLDDETLYASETGWEHILHRMPMLCDRDKWGTLDECLFPYDENENRPPESHHIFPLYDAAHREVFMFYLLDRQALEEGLITVLWLDNFGECVWWYRIHPDQVLEFEGGILSGCGLDWFVEMADGEEEGVENGYLAKGSLLD
ncbi:hypothetical protein CC86DRAFT_372602 [Ophiobolus disseminans]|uniref:Uncharacterized protein n=1 Tax=Ophiobolus disseminans TaxID=1469910 RepID=A0A6A6ZPI5_9PLEO|nr:hypothetical protein CC86DRAFT_372602 [Ophiobolus disseminans]